MLPYINKVFILLIITEQTRQELQQMKSELKNINEKLDTQMRDGTKNGGKQHSKAGAHYSCIRIIILLWTNA